MFEKITEIIPAPYLAGIAIYALIASGLAPTLQARHTQHFQAQCEVGIRAINEATVKRYSMPTTEGMVIGKMKRYANRIYPRGQNPFEILCLSDMFDGIVQQKRLQQRRTMENSLVDAKRHCTCLLSETHKETRRDYAIWVGSLRLIENTGVRAFFSVLKKLENDGICGKA